MDGFERRKEQSKESIRRAAQELIAKFGPNKVSVNEIARRAGVSQVTIYNLFGSKDNLIRECIQIAVDRFVERFRSILDADRAYIEKLEDIFQLVMEMHESNPDLAYANMLDDPEWRQFLDQLREQETKLFMEFVKEGKKGGHLNPELSDEAIEAYFELIIKGILSSPALHARMHHNPELLHDFLLIMLYGFGPTSRAIPDES